MNKIKLFVATLIAALTLTPAFAIVGVAHAASADANTISCGATGDLSSVTGDGGTCAPVDTTNSVNNTIKFAIRIFQFVVGIISIVMIILGGLKYITSGGESSNITSAKNTILYAVVGLIVVVLAQIIVQFVLTKAQAL